MLIWVTIALALSIVYVASRPKPTPTRCRCGKKAEIIDDAQPWRVWCAQCHVKHLQKHGEIL